MSELKFDCVYLFVVVVAVAVAVAMAMAVAVTAAVAVVIAILSNVPHRYPRCGQPSEAAGALLHHHQNLALQWGTIIIAAILAR